MWHFPTVPVGKNPEADLRTYLRKVAGSARALPPRFTPLRKIRHAVTYRAITVFPFIVSYKKLPCLPGAKAILLQDPSSVPISNLTRKVVRAALAATPH
jgi:hypothetical protein